MTSYTTTYTTVAMAVMVTVLPGSVARALLTKSRAGGIEFVNKCSVVGTVPCFWVHGVISSAVDDAMVGTGREEMRDCFPFVITPSTPLFRIPCEALCTEGMSSSWLFAVARAELCKEYCVCSG